jgi:hypothetical protein
VISNKSFRLFISSTFTDFIQERNILNDKVFPYLQKYCRSKGYNFLAIDLRWGVSQEAQLDQKTLELCLDEVKASKTYPFPNFFVMVGERYGWIPIPYAIEKTEFEELLKSINETEKFEIEKWYREDLNQIPVSYILQTRSGSYVDNKIWNIEENKLRTILQKTVNNNSFISFEQRDKFFLSATEQEIIAGIYGYTNSQVYNIDDNSHVYVFDRKTPSENNKSIDIHSYESLKKIKEKLYKVLPQSNIISIITSEYPNENNSEYIDDFANQVIEKLIISIDLQIKQTQDIDFIEAEHIEHFNFMKQKTLVFEGRDIELELIKKYLYSKENTPFVIHASSGMGKTSLMAKAIQRALEDSNVVIYRFIGATPASFDMRNLLSGIINEIFLKKSINNDINTFVLQQNETDFFNRISKFFETSNFDEPLYLFIDSLDQIHNKEYLSWLPKKLCKNLKIVLSTLDPSSDELIENQRQYGYYFYQLQQIYKADATYLQLMPPENPEQIIDSFLKIHNRKITEQQQKYLLKQYYESPSPLWLKIASEEARYWMSFTDNDTALSVGDGIIQEYFGNLSSLHHHNTLFVKRVLGFLAFSKNGLSEYELFDLLSQDKNLLKQCENEFHGTLNFLPASIWLRFYYQFKEFLVQRNVNGITYYNFLHRKFQEEAEKYTLSEKEYYYITLLKYYQDQLDFQYEHEQEKYLFLIAYYLYKLEDAARLLEHTKKYLRTINVACFFTGQAREYASYIRFLNDKNDFLSIQLTESLDTFYQRVLDSDYMKKSFSDLYFKEYFYLAKLFEIAGLLTDSINIFIKLMDLNQRMFGEYTLEVSNAMTDLIMLYKMLGDKVNSEFWTQQLRAIKYDTNQNPEDHLSNLRIVNSMTDHISQEDMNWFHEKISSYCDQELIKEVDSSNNYLISLELLNQMTTFIGEYSLHMHSVYLGQVVTLLKSEEYKKALDYLFVAENMMNTIVERNHVYQIHTFLYMALCFLKIKDFKNAQHYIDKLNEISNINYDDNEDMKSIISLLQLEYNITLGVLGQILDTLHEMFEQYNIETSVVLIDEAIEFINDKSINNHPMVTELFELSALVYMVKNKYSSFDFLQKAILSSANYYGYDSLNFQNYVSKISDAFSVNIKVENNQITIQ